MGDTGTPPDEPSCSDDDIERETVFYYSREHRLNSASPYVQAMNEEPYTKPGLSKRLFGSKSNLVLFVTIIVIVAGFTMGPRFFKKEPVLKIGENTVNLAVVQLEGTLFLDIVKKAPHSGGFYSGTAEIVVSPVNPKPKDGEGMKSFDSRIVFSSAESETFRISLPYEGSEFNVQLRTKDEQKSVKVKLSGK